MSDRAIVAVGRLFLGCPSCTCMRSNHRGVNHAPGHIRLLDHRLVQISPHALVAPPRIPLVDGIPSSIRGWQQAPLSTRTGHPSDRFNEASAVKFRAGIRVWMGSEESEDLWPLAFKKRRGDELLVDNWCIHAGRLPPPRQMSTKPRGRRVVCEPCCIRHAPTQ